MLMAGILGSEKGQTPRGRHPPACGWRATPSPESKERELSQGENLARVIPVLWPPLRDIPRQGPYRSMAIATIGTSGSYEPQEGRHLRARLDRQEGARS